MTKQQTKQLVMIQAYIDNGMNDNAARGLSAMIRAALRQSDKNELLAYANQYGLNNNPEFIV